MNRFARLANKFSSRIENYAAAEGVRLHRRDRAYKVRLLGYAIGVIVVVLLALWMSYHP